MHQEISYHTPPSGHAKVCTRKLLCASRGEGAGTYVKHAWDAKESVLLKPYSLPKDLVPNIAVVRVPGEHNQVRVDQNASPVEIWGRGRGRVNPVSSYDWTQSCNVRAGVPMLTLGGDLSFFWKP